MMDSRTQCKALKLKWIKYIKEQYLLNSQDFWFNWLKQCIPQIDIMDLLRCNLNYKDMNMVCKCRCTPFWQEVLQTWSEWNFNAHPMSKMEIINQPIWFNSLLRIGGGTIFYRKWYTHNILTIAQLIVNNRWINVDELYAKYNVKSNFLELHSIVSSIPVYWKYIIFDETDIEFEGYKVDRYSYECKDNYGELLKRIVCLPEQHVRRWEETLEIEIDEIDWYNSYTDCFTWTISTKLRSYYYQLRAGDIMTNSKLVKMRIKNDASCSWCSCKNQTLLHLFWECIKVKEIWHEVSKWLSNCLENRLEIKKELIFLFDIEAGNYTNIINFIVLIVSRYIYVCKCLDIIPTFKGVLNKISEIENIERSI